jgi:exodeoxyribonuclease X
MTAIILDTETTTIEDAEVIELAWERFDTFSQLASHSTVDRLHQRFTPLKPPAFGAMAVHHILPEDLVGLPPSEGAASYISSVTDYLIGHNIDFDWKALGCPTIPRICTLAMSRKLWPECDAHNLSAMVYFLFGANATTRARLRGAHSAAEDVSLCASVLGRCIEASGVKSFDELYAFSEHARIPVTMTFGKHRGELVADVPYGYAKWYRAQPDPDPYLLKAFKLAGK